MSKINVLDSAIFNRIAAGEVVENPRSVVKELVENSIDAGATSVTVEIREGGISYICVSDNGVGIDRTDMAVAFLPHATSKIRNLTDLDAITTLGFRGEALPSIASVADVEMLSRTQDSEWGYKISLRGGGVTNEGECGAPLGTKVTVRRLFADIPARAKFLRKPQAEESAVTDWMIKFVLANPTRKFKYVVDGETRLQSDGNGVHSAIHTVYGSDFLHNMEDISYTSSDITISGMVGKPNFTKHNRTYQTLIVNGRYVVHADISFCLQQCYQTYLMKRQFPTYVLYIDIPPDMVDVNVHPNKLEVRFVAEKRLKGILYNTVKQKIDALALEPVESSVAQMPEPIPETKATTMPTSPPRFVPVSPFVAEKKTTMSEPTFLQSKLPHFGQSVTVRSTGTPLSSSETVATVTQPVPPQKDLFASQEYPARYAGKLFNTYLLVESGNTFYIIDQHAAHEKLLYDRLVAQVEQGENAVQDLLIPYIFEVSPTERDFLTENLAAIADCGFKIDRLSGCSFSLYALPACCVDINLKQFVALLVDTSEGKKTSALFLKEKLMQAACKSAVKGEDDLSQSEIDSLLQQMRESDTAKYCPHGRPTVIRCERTDLEKLFKRV